MDVCRSSGAPHSNVILLLYVKLLASASAEYRSLMLKVLISEITSGLEPTGWYKEVSHNLMW